MQFNRKQYMAGEISHDDYYGQFVGASVLDLVSRAIGSDRIIRSEDEHFNDIPLSLWDALHPGIRRICGLAISESNSSTSSGSGGVSLSDTVCVAKAAARQIRDRGLEI